MAQGISVFVSGFSKPVDDRLVDRFALRVPSPKAMATRRGSREHDSPNQTPLRIACAAVKNQRAHTWLSSLAHIASFLPMSRDFSRSNRAAWREGTFLSPQHFQQAERFFEQRDHFVLEMAQPFPWGVIQRSIDANKIRNGEFHLERLHAILPDGLRVNIGRNDPLPPARAFESIFTPAKDTLTVYLGVPIETPGIPSYDRWPEEIHDRERQTRYCVHMHECYDRTREYAKREIEIASIRSRILFGGESREDHTCLPIARLTRASEGFVLDDEFIPPALSIAACSRTEERARALGNAARTKMVRLQSQRCRSSSRSSDPFAFSRRDAALVARLLPLGELESKLHSVLQAPNLPPFSLYTLLCECERQFSALHLSPHEAPHIPYRHDDLENTLTPLLKRLSAFVERPFRQSYLRVRLHSRSGGFWRGALEPDFLEARGELVLAITSDHTADELARRVPDLAKLASPSQITDVIARAVRGAPIHHMRHLPETIPAETKTVYFSLDQQHPDWQRVVEEKALALYLGVPLDKAPTRVEVMLAL